MPLSSPIIHCTTNYSQFKFLEKNRRIDHLNPIIESIKKNNMLYAHPIKVNKNMEIIDGQHRIRAAQQLNLPIYYMITDMTEDDIPLCQIQKTWQLQDYIHFYSHKPDYQFINEIAEKYKLQPHFIVRCCYFTGENVYKKIRSGEFKIKEKYESLDLKFKNCSEILKEIYNTCNIYTISEKPKLAVWKLVSSQNYNHKQFLHKIDLFPDNVRYAMKFRDLSNVYSELLLNVYNFRTKEQKNRIKQ